MKFFTPPIIVTLSLACASLPVAAADALTWSGSATAEREHDSSVGIDQIDDVSRESDYSKQLKAALGVKWQTTKNWQIAANYQGKKKVYDEFSEYDLDQKHLTLSTKYNFSGTKLSYRFDGVEAKIDGEDFLDFRQSTLALGRLLASKLYLRAALSANEKDYSQWDERDAEATIVSVDAMQFSNNGSTQFRVNLSAEDETAQVSLYDNKAISLNTEFQHKFKQAHFPTTFVTGVRVALKNYENFDVVTANQNSDFLSLFQPQESISEKRQDLRIQWMASLDVELHKHVGLLFKTAYIDNNSNYDAVSYDEWVTSLGLSVRF